MHSVWGELLGGAHNPEAPLQLKMLQPCRVGVWRRAEWEEWGDTLVGVPGFLRRGGAAYQPVPGWP